MIDLIKIIPEKKSIIHARCVEKLSRCSPTFALHVNKLRVPSHARNIPPNAYEG